MTYEAVSEDIQFEAPAKPEPTAVATRRDIAQVESTLTEFDKVAAGLEELRTRFPIDLVYEVSTTKGMTEARAHRAAWRDPRITVEKYRKAGKAPVLALGKNIDARAAWLTEQLLLGETPVDEQIKAEESRQAQIKADKEAAEFGRVMAMQEAVGEIAMLAMVNGLSSVVIAARLESLRTEVLDPKVYQEMLPQAEAARTAAIGKLEQAFKAAQWDEAEAARKAAEAEAVRVAQAAADVERARVSAAQAEESKRLQEARDMIATAEREAQERIAAQQAEIDRQRAAWLAEQEAAKPKPAQAEAPNTPARDSQQVLKAEAATPDATDRDAPVTTSPSVGSMGAGQPADAGATTDTLMLLRDALALTLYAGQPFAGKFPAHPKPSPEWWAGLREQIETLQPLLIAAIEQSEGLAA